MPIRSIPPITALSRRSNIPERKYRLVGLNIGLGGFNGSNKIRISNEGIQDRWSALDHEHKSEKVNLIRKKKPKIVIQSDTENQKVNIEVHDNGDHYQLISVSGKPSGLGIENIMLALGKLMSETLKNGVWTAKIGK